MIDGLFGLRTCQSCKMHTSYIRQRDIAMYIKLEISQRKGSRSAAVTGGLGLARQRRKCPKCNLDTVSRMQTIIPLFKRSGKSSQCSIKQGLLPRPGCQNHLIGQSRSYFDDCCIAGFLDRAR
ncbi:hypothetical protein AD941_01690 [Gluconobacter albidus]|uniref:Transposase n=1 Tax=Gluconobacter albidus TaxID=318683 RepID=A0AAW3QZH3_9PROT|nr:hypothetical protein AD941_01690 [Gluconobacter albidus]